MQKILPDDRMRIFRSAALLLAAFVLAVAVGACGKKGPPKAPDLVLPPPPADLRARVVDGDLTLYWTVPSNPADVAAPVNGYQVYKAVNKLTEDGCKNCPRRYRVVGDVAVSTAGAADNGRPGLTFSETISKGYRYTYKVRGYLYNGTECADSEILEFDFK